MQKKEVDKYCDNFVIFFKLLGVFTAIGMGYFRMFSENRNVLKIGFSWNFLIALLIFIIGCLSHEKKTESKNILQMKDWDANILSKTFKFTIKTLKNLVKTNFLFYLTMYTLSIILGIYFFVNIIGKIQLVNYIPLDYLICLFVFQLCYFELFALLLLSEYYILKRQRMSNNSLDRT